MQITSFDEVMKAKARIREIYAEMKLAHEIRQFYEKTMEQPLTHPNDILYLENAKKYEVYLNEQLKKPHDALLRFRGFPISFDRN